ncbi:hypothetical protein C1645_836296 [Glomus cerebriforme]|uniref:Sel1 repeat family protein n=1 Tax=Glomus cerebriforme TaxID=658196 RepID=A0A397S790_9GLOM|nr:hypothetical protein C1645_836296 [Glomus cerebriforme]
MCQYGIDVSSISFEKYLRAAEKNESKAPKWYLNLANKNGPRAIYLVAKCYRDGIGSDKNLTEATK